MKFTAKEDFQSKGRFFEAGNTYDSAKHGIDDADVSRWYGAGWCDIEGRDPAPERNMNGVTVKPDSAKHEV